MAVKKGIYGSLTSAAWALEACNHLERTLRHPQIINRVKAVKRCQPYQYGRNDEEPLPFHQIYDKACAP